MKRPARKSAKQKREWTEEAADARGGRHVRLKLKLTSICRVESRHGSHERYGVHLSICQHPLILSIVKDYEVKDGCDAVGGP
jgi:hypothetical protein